MIQHNWVRTIYHHKLFITYFDRTTVFYPLVVTNNTTMGNTPSADGLRAAFTFLRFDSIFVEPSYEKKFKLETRATRNAATVVIRLHPPHNKPIWHLQTSRGLNITGRSTFPTAAKSWKRSTFSCRRNTHATPEHTSRI